MAETRRGALLGAVVLAAGLMSGACASTGTSVRAGAVTAGPSLAPARIPPAPATSPEPVRQAWDRLQHGQPPAGVGPASSAASSPEELALRGFAALLGGDVAGARDAFGAALGLRDGLAEAAYGMGIVAELEQRPDLAADWYQAALRAQPNMIRAGVALRRLRLARIDATLTGAERAQAEGDLEGAIAAYRQAIELAPAVPGTYLRLANVYREAGNEADATRTLEQGVRAVGDRAELLQPLAQAYRHAGRLAEAVDVLTRLRDLRPEDQAVRELVAQVQRQYEESSLPVQYRSLASKPVITRQELAAILAVNLEILAQWAPTASGVVASDSVDRWSTPFIQRVVSWGILDVYQSDFLPDMQVRRSMLVEACYRALQLAGIADSAPRPALEDPPPEHLLYRPVQAVVGLGLMKTDSDGSFDLLAPVSGAEALQTVERLAAVLRRAGGRSGRE